MNPHCVLYSLGVALALFGCNREPIGDIPADTGKSSGLSSQGESCTKTADCEPGLKCVALTCVDESQPDGEPIIVDNRDGGFEVVSGEWGYGDPDDGNGCYGPDFRYAFADRDDIGRARFDPGITAPREMEVAIWWPAESNRTADQPVVVRDTAGEDHTYHVNLQEQGNQWVVLGKHVFGPDTWVEFNTDTDDGYCNADAVRFANPPQR